jgi:glycosyltransferase involved in cell wall biosynthesis
VGPPRRARPDVSIISTAHDVADARLHREVAALIRNELSVEVLALGAAANGPTAAQIRTTARRGPLLRAVRALLIPWRARGRVVITLDPDVAFGAWLRRAVLGRRRTRLVVDVHEDYGALLRDRAWARGPVGLIARVWGGSGMFAAARSDLAVVADDHLQPTLRRRIVLRNLPDLSMLPGPSDREQHPRALYVGDLRASRGLFEMVEAVRTAPGWSLDLVGPVSKADAARLADLLAEDDDLSARVRLHGRLPPARAWELARGAWVGLLLLADTPAFREAIPSKLYEYLHCGLAVISTDLPRSAQLLNDSGAGHVVRDAARAADQLREWSSDTTELEAKRRAARAWAAAHQPGAEMAAFAQAVERLAQLK